MAEDLKEANTEQSDKEDCEDNEYKDRIAEKCPEGRFFRFNEELGFGAFKVVYRAYDSDSGCEVAWNVIKFQRMPASMERLEIICQTVANMFFVVGETKRISEEITLLKNLHHQNIMSFITAWINSRKNQVVFITECVSGGSLKRQILKGLVYLHDQKPFPVIHRDIKCENVFINTTSNEIRIGDLGLAVALKNSSHTSSVIGTPEFMAPEIYEEKYGTPVDIYSFGMCVLEMATLTTPYRECTSSAQVYKKVSQGILPSQIEMIQSEGLKNIILWCLSPSQQRPSAAQLLNHPFFGTCDAEEDNHPVQLNYNFQLSCEEEDYPKQKSQRQQQEELELLSLGGGQQTNAAKKNEKNGVDSSSGRSSSQSHKKRKNQLTIDIIEDDNIIQQDHSQKQIEHILNNNLQQEHLNSNQQQQQQQVDNHNSQNSGQNKDAKSQILTVFEDQQEISDYKQAQLPQAQTLFLPPIYENNNSNSTSTLGEHLKLKSQEQIIHQKNSNPLQNEGDFKVQKCQTLDSISNNKLGSDSNDSTIKQDILLEQQLIQNNIQESSILNEQNNLKKSDKLDESSKNKQIQQSNHKQQQQQQQQSSPQQLNNLESIKQETPKLSNAQNFKSNHFQGHGEQSSNQHEQTTSQEDANHFTVFGNSHLRESQDNFQKDPQNEQQICYSLYLSEFVQDLLFRYAFSLEIKDHVYPFDITVKQTQINSGEYTKEYICSLIQEALQTIDFFTVKKVQLRISEDAVNRFFEFQQKKKKQSKFPELTIGNTISISPMKNVIYLNGDSKEERNDQNNAISNAEEVVSINDGAEELHSSKDNEDFPHLPNGQNQQNKTQFQQVQYEQQQQQGEGIPVQRNLAQDMTHWNQQPLLPQWGHQQQQYQQQYQHMPYTPVNNNAKIWNGSSLTYHRRAGSSSSQSRTAVAGLSFASQMQGDGTSPFGDRNIIHALPTHFYLQKLMDNFIAYYKQYWEQNFESMINESDETLQYRQKKEIIELQRIHTQQKDYQLQHQMNQTPFSSTNQYLFGPEFPPQHQMQKVVKDNGQPHFVGYEVQRNEDNDHHSVLDISNISNVKESDNDTHISPHLKDSIDIELSNMLAGDGLHSRKSPSSSFPHNNSNSNWIPNNFTNAASNLNYFENVISPQNNSQSAAHVFPIFQQSQNPIKKQVNPNSSVSSSSNLTSQPHQIVQSALGGSTTSQNQVPQLVSPKNISQIQQNVTPSTIQPMNKPSTPSDQTQTAGFQSSEKIKFSIQQSNSINQKVVTVKPINTPSNCINQSNNNIVIISNQNPSINNNNNGQSNSSQKVSQDKSQQQQQVVAQQQGQLNQIQPKMHSKPPTPKQVGYGNGDISKGGGTPKQLFSSQLPLKPLKQVPAPVRSGNLFSLSSDQNHFNFQVQGNSNNNTNNITNNSNNTSNVTNNNNTNNISNNNNCNNTNSIFSSECTQQQQDSISKAQIKQLKNSIKVGNDNPIQTAINQNNQNGVSIKQIAQQISPCTQQIQSNPQQLFPASSNISQSSNSGSNLKSSENTEQSQLQKPLAKLTKKSSCLSNKNSNSNNQLSINEIPPELGERRDSQRQNNHLFTSNFYPHSSRHELREQNQQEPADQQYNEHIQISSPTYLQSSTHSHSTQPSIHTHNHNQATPHNQNSNSLQSPLNTHQNTIQQSQQASYLLHHHHQQQQIQSHQFQQVLNPHHGHHSYLPSPSLNQIHNGLSHIQANPTPLSQSNNHPSHPAQNNTYQNALHQIQQISSPKSLQQVSSPPQQQQSLVQHQNQNNEQINHTHQRSHHHNTVIAQRKTSNQQSYNSESRRVTHAQPESPLPFLMQTKSRAQQIQNAKQTFGLQGPLAPSSEIHSQNASESHNENQQDWLCNPSQLKQSEKNQ